MTTTRTNTAFAPLIGLMLIVSLLTPSLASAASSRPSCTLTVTTSAGDTKVSSGKKATVMVSAGEEIEIAWKGKNASEAELNGDDVDVSDEDSFTVSKDTTYAFTFTKGSKDVECTVKVEIAKQASIATKSLSSKNDKLSLRGDAGAYKKLYVAIYKEGSTSSIFSKKVSSSKSTWKVKTKALKEGTYEVRLMDGSGKDAKVLDRETIVVDEDGIKGGKSSKASLAMSLLPLLSGGTARANQSVQVSYIRVKNSGSEPAHITGFTVRQDGSASTDAIASFETIDDKGQNQTTSVANFSGTSSTVLANAVIPPGQTRIITIKAVMGGNAAAFAGSDLRIVVTGAETDGAITTAFPIPGTVWTIGS